VITAEEEMRLRKFFLAVLKNKMVLAVLALIYIHLPSHTDTTVVTFEGKEV